jgi:hypothetical protein
MKTSCKSCQNWKLISEERGWCANFSREIVNNTTCGEWRARRSQDSGLLTDGAAKAFEKTG